ncbi:MAG TPA: phasin family protein [Stellaceae bacterium]|nr:phasin family protein [Stellaceae bacterium]
MSDEKQNRTKRAAAPQQTESETAVMASETPEPAALPPPEARMALPAPVPEWRYGAERYFAAYRATLASIGESQAAIASDVTAMALEMSGLARSNLTAAGDGVTAFLSARSLVDAVEAQLGFARRTLDAFASGSTRLGELGLRLVSDATKPMTKPFAAV